jgi:hypothetical protein
MLVSQVGNMPPIIVKALVGKKAPNNGKFDRRLGLAKGA